MKLSKAGEKVGHYFEQCKLEAYPDPGSKDGKPWTIGWGHTGPEVVPGLVWTQAQADAAFLSDVSDAERAVTKHVRVPITQGQFDALVLFVYNLGSASFAKSTLLKLLNAYSYDAAQAQFARWNKNDGKAMLGLSRRRLSEACLFAGMSADEAIAKAKSLK